MNKAWKASPFVLKYFDTFQELPEKDLLALTEWSELRHYKEGDILISQGEAPDSAMYILNGALKLSRTICNIHGRDESYVDVIVQFFGAGDCIGDTSLYEDYTFKGSISAISDCEVLVVDRTELIKLAENNPNILKNLYIRTSKKFLRMVEGIDLSYGSLIDRIEVLATECRKVGIDLYQHFSKADIARMLGVSRVSVSKQLNSYND